MRFLFSLIVLYMLINGSSSGHNLEKRQVRLTQHLNPPQRIDPIPETPNIYMPRIGSNDLNNFINKARISVSNLVTVLEPKLYSEGIILKPGTSAWLAAITSQAKISTKNASMIALWAEEATKELAKNKRLTKDQVIHGLPKVDLRSTDLGRLCPISVDRPCEPKKYRAYNGFCNNVQNPHWGSANTRYSRFLSADYSDGISAPRKSISGSFLPSPRTITLQVHSGQSVKHKHISAIFAYWGQFIAHDISHTSQASGFKQSKIKCCGIPFEDFHPECFPIAIPKNDHYYGQLKQTCMEYVRSSISPMTGCTLGSRQQVNQATSFLDGSTIYGTSEEEANKLRSYRNGRLKISSSRSSEEMLPMNSNSEQCKSSNKQCFKSGDLRVNENNGLVLIHTLWMREHNRIANKLKIINRHWNDEQIFQESRKIVGAEVQHITYSYFLPILLGNEVMEEYGLTQQATGYFTGYDINMDPSVANSVATSVLKFFIAMMPQNFKLIDGNFREVGSMPVSETNFESHDMLKKGKMDQYLRGLLNARADDKDAFISEEFTNRMFFDSSKGYGMDFVSMIIQQGRDHGIPAYIEWRNFCKLGPVIKRWEDFHQIMPLIVVESLKRIYRHVEDIDLFTGGLAERSMTGAIVGPTFACILGRQFHYLRRGDRYWYENDLPPSSFSRDQLEEIRKTTLNNFLCENAKSVDYIQPDALFMSDAFLNAVSRCNENNVRVLDLSKWQEAAPKFNLPHNVIENSVNEAKKMVENFVNTEKRTLNNNEGVASRKSPEAIHHRFSQPKRLARKIANQSLFLEFTSNSLLNSISPRNRKDFEQAVPSRNMLELASRLGTVDVSKLVDVPQMLNCEESTLPCDHTSQFRTYNGWCNNLQNPEYGKSMSIYNRLLPPQYDDGLNTPRERSVTGKQLPSPRLISSTVHDDVDAPHVKYSLMVMQFGQFLDHDITMTPVSEGFEDSILDCKRCDSKIRIHPECYPIPIPENDVFYPSHNVTTGEPRCLSFTRSMPGQLTLGFRQQLNQLTAYIDASNVYGSDRCDAESLRLHQRGFLNTTLSKFHGQKPLLPLTSTNHECKSPSGLCFTAGDARASEQPGLASLHTLFMRQHNKIVQGLSLENPRWTDEKLYQNGRRITSAILQHISYKEFLPRILGWDFIYRYKLDLLPQGYSNRYEKNCKADLFNEFAGAAFRFGHSLIRPSLPKVGRNYIPKRSDIPLRSAFFNSDVLHEIDAIDDLVRGLISSSMASLDNSLTDEVTNHLFEDRRVPFSGMDLGALNIQRGRDHGFPSYNQYRGICNLTKVTSFNQLSREVSREMINRLESVYDDVDDIDLFTGGLVETPLHGGLVGPTFGCIIARQFRSLRMCDRFWYENDDPLIRFTESQLMEIRKISLSKVICENSDSINTIQRMSMDLSDDFLNPIVSCKSLPSLDLKHWRERQSCNAGNITIPVGGAGRISPCVMCTCTKEGPMCQSIKVRNCLSLARNYPISSVLSDDICKVQCAHAFSLFPRIPAEGSQILGFTNS